MVLLNHDEYGGNRYVGLVTFFLLRGGCLPSIPRATWNLRLFSWIAYFRSRSSIGDWSLLLTLVAICATSMSLSLISNKWQALASHLYTHFFFNAELRYLTIKYFETGIWNTEREATYMLQTSILPNYHQLISNR